MTRAAALALALVLFTRPDGAMIYIESTAVVAASSPSAVCAHPTDTWIKTSSGGELCVRDSLMDTVLRLKAAPR